MIDFFRKWYHHYISTPQAAILILQFITIYVLIYYFNSIIGPIIAALVLAFIFERPVSFLVKHGTSRLKASILVTLSYIAIIIALIIAILPPALDQLASITKSISNILSTPVTTVPNNNKNNYKVDITNPTLITDNINSDANNLLNTNGSSKIPNSSTLSTSNTNQNTNLKDSNLASNLSLNETILTKKSSQDTITETPNQSQNAVFLQAEQWLIQKIKELTPKLPASYRDFITEQHIHEAFIFSKNALQNWLSPILTTKIAPFIMDTFSLLLYLIIVPIFTFYMLKDKDKWIEFGKKFLSPYEEISNFWYTINKQIGQYLNGNIIHIVISALVNGIAFGLFGLNNALILGIGVGLSVIIPYVGAIIITIPFLIISVIQFGFSADLVWLLAIYIVIQLLDSYLLTPLLFSETLNLDAFTILLSIMIFGGIWGFWGVVLAIPLATFIKTAFTMWPKNNSPLTKS